MVGILVQTIRYWKRKNKQREEEEEYELERKRGKENQGIFKKDNNPDTARNMIEKE